jgi:hypothetical protein
MSAVANRGTEAPHGTDFVRLFKLEVGPFKLPGQKPGACRDGESLDRPYELSDLMREAIAAGVWPRQK